MIDSLLALLTPYLYATFLSIVMCLIVYFCLRIINKRSYGKRTLMLIIPLLGSIIIVGFVSVSCFIHWLSMSNLSHYSCFGVCSQLQSGSIGLVCSSLVIVAFASSGFAISLGLLNHYFGGAITIHLIKAKPLNFNDTKETFETVHCLSTHAGIKTPRLYMMEGSTPIVFTVGKKSNSAIVISVGLLETLSLSELETVLAHEISHIRNNDNLLKTLISSLKFYSPFILPSHLIEPAVYREREFLADEGSVTLTGKPKALISALLKIGEAHNYASKQGIFSRSAIGFYFKVPRKGGVFSKHPPLIERLNRLMQLMLLMSVDTHTKTTRKPQNEKRQFDLQHILEYFQLKTKIILFSTFLSLHLLNLVL